MPRTRLSTRVALGGLAALLWGSGALTPPAVHCRPDKEPCRTNTVKGTCEVIPQCIARGVIDSKVNRHPDHPGWTTADFRCRCAFHSEGEPYKSLLGETCVDTT